MNEGMGKQIAEKLTESFEIVYKHQNATKDDLLKSGTRLKIEFKQIKTQLEAKIAEINQSIVESRLDWKPK